MILHTGMGAYPGDGCYDPGRFSWLPLWWDNQKEATCIIATALTTPRPGAGGSLLIPPLPPAAPQTEEEMRDWDPERVYAAQAGQWAQWKALNREAIAYEGVIGREFEEGNAPGSTLAQWWEKNKWFALGAGAAVLAVAQLTKR